MMQGNTKKIIALAVLIIIMLTAINHTKFGKVNMSPIESALKDIVVPVQGLVMNVGHRLRGLVSFPLRIVNMSEENQLMKDKITKLEGQLRQFEEMKSENDRFQVLLDFKSNTAPMMGYNLATASVVGHDISNWFGILTLNKGSAHGLNTNMVVVNDQGLIGRIISITEHTADVLLVTDPRSGVAALIQENRATGLLEGVANAPGYLKMVHIPLDSDLHPGQVVISSGFGSLYPKGIPIGRITDIEPDPSGLFLSALVTPFVDINKLEEVMIITEQLQLQPQSEPNVSLLPYPWGQGDSAPKKGGRSPGALTVAEQNEVIVR